MIMNIIQYYHCQLEPHTDKDIFRIKKQFFNVYRPRKEDTDCTVQSILYMPEAIIKCSKYIFYMFIPIQS